MVLEVLIFDWNTLYRNVPNMHGTASGSWDHDVFLSACGCQHGGSGKDHRPGGQLPSALTRSPCRHARRPRCAHPSCTNALLLPQICSILILKRIKSRLAHCSLAPEAVILSPCALLFHSACVAHVLLCSVVLPYECGALITLLAQIETHKLKSTTKLVHKGLLGHSCAVNFLELPTGTSSAS